MPRPDVVIHVHPGVAWQVAFLDSLTTGLRAARRSFAITASPVRVGGGLPVLLGTTFWAGVEDGGPFLLVDRCSFGDPGTWVTLVRDGHGRRGDHRVPETVDGSRWERAGVDVLPWRESDEGAVVLCGQTRTWCRSYPSLDGWYAEAGRGCTHFRPHPAAVGAGTKGGPRDRSLPPYDGWHGVARAVTLNSSVGVEAVLLGIPTVTMDEGAMAWGVTGHRPDDIRRPDRTPWLHWLAWTQWHRDEIRAGTPWERVL